MLKSSVDIAIIIAFLVSVIGIGIAGMRRSSKSAESFFPFRTQHTVVAFGCINGCLHVLVRHAESDHGHCP